jgi:3-hydroxyisobutyrate dehydrogenase
VIAFLGIGRMGLPMATNVLRAGFPLRVWNRTPNRLESLVAAGATAGATPAEAVDGASVAITMLTDGSAVDAVMSGRHGALTSAAPNLVWAQMSTVGLSWTESFIASSHAHGVRFVDAPVSGSEVPAQKAELTILASGSDDVHDVVEPVFAAMGKQTVWVGPAGNGNRMKLVLNNWLADLVELTAESVNFAQRLDLDPALVVGLLESTPLGSPYAVSKAHAMLNGDFTPSFALKHALKDALLALDAAHASKTELPLTDALVARWQPFAAAGHGDDDVASVFLAQARGGVKPASQPTDRSSSAVHQVPIPQSPHD